MEIMDTEIIKNKHNGAMMVLLMVFLAAGGICGEK